MPTGHHSPSGATLLLSRGQNGTSSYERRAKQRPRPLSLSLLFFLCERQISKQFKPERTMRELWVWVWVEIFMFFYFSNELHMCACACVCLCLLFPFSFPKRLEIFHKTIFLSKKKIVFKKFYSNHQKVGFWSEKVQAFQSQCHTGF